MKTYLHFQSFLLFVFLASISRIFSWRIPFRVPWVANYRSFYLHVRSTDEFPLIPPIKIYDPILPFPPNLMINPNRLAPILLKPIDSSTQNLTAADVLVKLMATTTTVTSDNNEDNQANKNTIEKSQLSFTQRTANLAIKLQHAPSTIIDNSNPISSLENSSENHSENHRENHSENHSEKEIDNSLSTKNKITTLIKEETVPDMLTIVYLKNELKLNEKTLSKILMYHSWTLYLKVNTNLRPKLEIFKSFGFKEKDIRSIIQSVPSVLGIDYKWTLPEKLISIIQMFHLTKTGLVKLVVNQPWLLTSSIDRNRVISKYLNEMGFENEKLKQFVLSDPRVVMNSIEVLSGCWRLLTEVYGLSDKKAMNMCMRYPRLLSSTFLSNGKKRLEFFRSTLGLVVPFEDLQSIIERYPPLLIVNIDYFLKPNVKTIVHYLDLDLQYLQKMIGVFPQILGHNPHVLEQRCREILYFLTSDMQYKDNSLTIDEHNNHDNHSNSNSHRISNMDISELSHEEDNDAYDMIDYDVLKDIAITKISSEADDVQAMYIMTSSFSIDIDRAKTIIRTTPWWLAFRPERTRSILLGLALSLGLTRTEVERCITIYPRIVNLSLRGKLTELLRVLSEYAILYIHSPNHSIEINEIIQLSSNNDEYEHLRQIRNQMAESLQQRRSDPIRSLIRYLILQNPLILGTSVTRIRERMSEVMIESKVSGSGSVSHSHTHSHSHNKERENDQSISLEPRIGWKKLASHFRRNGDVHIRWKENQNKKRIKEELVAQKKNRRKRRSSKEHVTVHVSE